MGDIPILVIEDDKEHQMLFLMQLTRAGFADVTIVGSASEGLDACHERPRDVLIVDSGVVPDQRDRWLSELKQSCAEARVIVYSSGVQKEVWADAHFLKGSDTESLLAEIRKGLKSEA